MQTLTFPDEEHLACRNPVLFTTLYRGNSVCLVFACCGMFWKSAFSTCSFPVYTQSVTMFLRDCKVNGRGWNVKQTTSKTNEYILWNIVLSEIVKFLEMTSSILFALQKQGNNLGVLIVLNWFSACYMIVMNKITLWLSQYGRTKE